MMIPATVGIKYMPAIDWGGVGDEASVAGAESTAKLVSEYEGQLDSEPAVCNYSVFSFNVRGPLEAKPKK